MPRRYAVDALTGAVLALAALPAAAQNSEAQQVVVTGATAENSVTQVGKGPQALKEIAQSVTVISQERIEQQALKTLDDVLLQTTGVTREELWLGNNYYARGLAIENIRYDGGAVSQITDRNNEADTSMFEEVSLLRGADGLFGATDAGGVINLRSKRPRADTAIAGSLSIGRWNNHRVELDATGPLTEGGMLKGRAIAAYQDQDHFFEPSHSRREVFYGMLSADPTDDTSIYAGASLQNDRQTAFNRSLMRYVDGADPGFDRSTTMGVPWGFKERRNTAFFGGLGQQLGPGWKLDVNLRHTKGRDAINGAEMEGAISYATLSSSWWRYQDGTRFSETLLDANLQGSFQAFGQKHDLIFGLDHTRSRTDFKQNWVYYGEGNAFDREAPPEWAYPPESWDSSSLGQQRASSAYASLRVRPIAPLAITLGGRKVLRETMSLLDRNTGLQDDFRQRGDFVPFVGVVFDATPTIALYASHAEIKQSQLRYFESETGPSLRPATGRNLELGVKAQLLGGRLAASAAVFDLRKQNEAVYVDWVPTGSNAWCCYRASGNKQSRGVDLELNGKVLPGWTLSLGYTYNDNESRSDEGQRFSTITPRHLLKIWSHHQLDRLLPGLSFGWGVNTQSTSYQSGFVQPYNPATGLYDGEWQAYDFTQKGYAVWSLQAAYDITPSLSVAVNAKNVFDKVYYSTIGSSGYGNFYGEPRNVMVTLKAKY